MVENPLPPDPNHGPPAFLTDLVRLMEAIPLGLALAGPTGKLLSANRRIQETLGYSAEEMKGLPVSRIHVETGRGPSLPEIFGASMGGGWVGEISVRRRDGSTFPVFLETSPVHGPPGTPAAVVLVARDLTDQRALQERLLTEARQGTLGLIVQNVTHSVRNHLAALKMSTYMLETSRDPGPEEKIHFDIMREEMKRIEVYLRTLGDRASPRPSDLGEHDLLSTIDQGLEDARRVINLRSASLRRQFPHTSPVVVLDPQQIAQAVCEVTRNACESMGDGGDLHVVVKRRPQKESVWWRVEIRDSGPGIPPHLQPRVFEPFFSTRPQHLGLGLSNVKRILESHGGGVSIQSTVGRGTSVVMDLPQNGRGAVPS